MRHFPHLIMVLSLLALALIPQCLHAQTTDETPVVREIEIRGFERLTEAARTAVRARITAAVGQPVNEQTVQADTEALLESGWFVSVEPKTEPIENGVRLVYQVVENPVITGVRFHGNTRISSAELAALVQSKPGDVLNQVVASEDASAIERAYALAGYSLVRVTNIEIEKDTDVLQFTIFEPRISEIRIVGNTKTREHVIRRELLFKPGDVYNKERIGTSLDNLKRLGIFDELQATTEPGSEPGTLTIILTVKERRTGMASIGFGHSNVQGFIGFVDVADTNLFGTGQRLSARVQFGSSSSYELSYTNPWINRQRTSFTTNLYDRSILREAVVGTRSFPFDESRTGGNITFGRPISRGTQAYVTFRADRVRATDVPVELSNPTPTPEEPGLIPYSEFEPRDVRSITLTGVRDTRRYPRDATATGSPIRGSYTSLSTEYAGFGGVNYTKFSGELRGFFVAKRKRVPSGTENTGSRDWVLASRLMAGTMTGNPPFLDQFLLGGANTLRGYQEDRFPGKNMLLLNTELRVPMGGALQGVLFADTGDAWGGNFASVAGDDSFTLHTGYGLGVRVETPIGPLRLDYGWNDEGGNQFHFGVGASF